MKYSNRPKPSPACMAGVTDQRWMVKDLLPEFYWKKGEKIENIWLSV
jgi:hypothetical protein